ncbi:heme exporter protein CcmD [Idiomarina tyrosinivorans]|uniref:Heme exporter protein D n=1 Tax=Idiomarina tyrosinivorans TaxID=1445662 RepID=A0A432ZPL2_9GAMM|nr:heme exporter protein CcmD [Idiomarina tyrosinivorans]RUO79792.1 heme exporter protein CcmD [Idiomarina tyrosinivorans]
MDKLLQWLHMGGYGVYVWSAFFVTFLLLAGLAIHAVWVRKGLAQQSERLQQRRSRLKRRQQSSKPQE